MNSSGFIIMLRLTKEFLGFVVFTCLVHSHIFFRFFILTSLSSFVQTPSALQRNAVNAIISSWSSCVSFSFTISSSISVEKGIIFVFSCSLRSSNTSRASSCLFLFLIIHIISAITIIGIKISASPLLALSYMFLTISGALPSRMRINATASNTVSFPHFKNYRH